MPSKLPASYVSKVHTTLASAAFLSALVIGLKLHYRKIVKNEVAGYPDEWWPSVSATIGDWYPERSVFQILIALTAGPRFALIFCWWLLTRSASSRFPTFVAIAGMARTFTCGGWVYITSSDDHNTHDVLMISYMVLSLPWMVGSILCTPVTNHVARKRRKLVASLFFTTIIPLVYLFVQHKIHKVPGAYTKYSFCEWFLIFSDVWFDSITAMDFSVLEISVSRASEETTEAKKYDRRQLLPQRVVIRPSVTSKPPPANPKASPLQKNSGGLKVGSPSYGLGKQASLIASTWRFTFPLPTSWRISATFLADVFLAYMWWSIFTSLAPTLFYFSVWQLSISGQEVSLISTLSPIILRAESARAALYTHRSRTWLQALSVVGLLAYAVDSPLLRLLAVSFANVTGSLLRAIEWSGQQEAQRNGIVLTLGLIVSSISKFINHSVNPIWPFVNGQSGGWNKTGILMAVVAVWEYATRDYAAPAKQNTDQAPSKEPVDSSSEAAKRSSDTQPETMVEVGSGFLAHWSLPSVGLGSLIFSLHCLLADSGTLIAYSWTGYPITGPLPGSHGSLTLVAMALGVVISSSSIGSVVYHPLWMAFGTSSVYFMYKWQDWPGYLAGLFLATFLTSLVPEVMRLASVHGKNYPGKVYLTAWLTVCVLDLANVWTVAYAFVPAGWLLRERTDIVLSMQMIALILGLIPAWQRPSSGTASSSPDLNFRHHVKRLLALLMLVSFLTTTAWIPSMVVTPYHAAERLITAGIWTVHFGIDDEGRESQYRMRDLIKDMELDIVGLLETDLHRIVFGNRDLTLLIAKELGYYVDIGPGPNSHTWGAALLSKFPILTSTHHLLPSPNGELAPAISAVLDVWGQNITVVVSHNGQEEDALDRELQSTELARIMAASYPEPLMFLGYVVTKPLAARPDPYEILVTDGLMHDIDEEDWDRWCEYILYRGLYRVAYARVSRSTITDTELQVGKFVVPKLGRPIVNASREDRYLRNYREIFPPSMWFPDEYLDKINPGGTRGHFYHVHPWPLYYGLPENAVV